MGLVRLEKASNVARDQNVMSVIFQNKNHFS